MDIFLTEEELVCEKSLFAPHETLYKRPEGRTGDIRSSTLPDTESSADSDESPEKEHADSSQMGPPPVAC